MRPPSDWTLTLDDHGHHGLVVEVRHRGQLVHRSTVTLDQVLLEHAIEGIVERSHPSRQARLRSVGP